MISKTLSKSDREEILAAVESKAFAKWNDTPLYDEMMELEREAARIFWDMQMARHALEFIDE